MRPGLWLVPHFERVGRGPLQRVLHTSTQSTYAQPRGSQPRPQLDYILVDTTFQCQEVMPTSATRAACGLTLAALILNETIHDGGALSFSGRAKPVTSRRSVDVPRKRRRCPEYHPVSTKVSGNYRSCSSSLSAARGGSRLGRSRLSVDDSDRLPPSKSEGVAVTAAALKKRTLHKARRIFAKFRRKQCDDTVTTASNERLPRRALSPAFQRERIKQSIQISRVQSFAMMAKPTDFSTRRRTTSLQMVLSTPDTVIEQASTEKLLDTLIDESVRTNARQPVMMQFNPKRGWIWKQWRGTVFSETWKSGLSNMALATLVVFLYGAQPKLKDLLQGFSILWGQLLSVTTFTLTFFLNQSYGLWRKCYDYSRRLQGRLNDLGLTLAAHATRTKPSSSDVPSTYTPQSRQVLELVSRYVRVFNLLTYASFTRSHRPILTPRGMRRLVERGILTNKEREILTEADVPATQRHNAVLVWLTRLFLEGTQTGVFEGGTGFEQQFMEKIHVIRAQYGAIGDELQGRMPLAYAHIVQVLLDVVLWMYPFMALSTGMAWHLCIAGTFLLTMFYQGLFDLAKQFLDPYDNECFGKFQSFLT